MTAFLLSGPTEVKTKMKLYWDKKDFVVELVHTPKRDDRKIFIDGYMEIGITYSSFIQSDGLDCHIIHLRKWRDVPKVGNMIVVIKFENKDGKITEKLEQEIILGPPPMGPVLFAGGF